MMITTMSSPVVSGFKGQTPYKMNKHNLWWQRTTSASEID